MANNLTLDLRPRVLDEVLGLEPQIAALRKILEDGKKPKPFLLTGLFGCGKTTLAYIIAREVQGWEFTGTPQVLEINAANIRGIGPMREIADGAGNYPMVGKYQVIILDEAHQLTKEAQQVLLKEFEQLARPTVWIVCTTNPEKINEGVRDRCTALPPLTGMDAPTRTKLVERAAAFAKYEGPVDAFLAELTKSRVVSPRKILKAFEGLTNGLSPQMAVAASSWDMMPEYFEIAMGVVFGQWDKPFILPWIVDVATKQPKNFKSVADQLKALDDLLGKKKQKEETPATAPAPATEVEGEDPVEEEDTQGRPETSRALRAIVAASLKNQVYKGAAKAQKAADALFILSHCTSPNPFDAGMEWAATVGGLFRVNQKMMGR